MTSTSTASQDCLPPSKHHIEHELHTGWSIKSAHIILLDILDSFELALGVLFMTTGTFCDPKLSVVVVVPFLKSQKLSLITLSEASISIIDCNSGL